MTKADALAGLAGASPAAVGPTSDFDLNPEMVLPEGRGLREAGVLLAFRMREDVPHLILTKRSSALRHHPGQIAFPGGKVEPVDCGATDAALREAEEEIGLARDNVEVLGVAPVHETVTGFRITPVLGRVRADFTPRAERGEVDEVFSVPWPHLADLSRYSVQSRLWRGNWRHYYAVPYGPYYIWGATARILRTLAEHAR